jgi:hypothetical protein
MCQQYYGINNVRSSKDIPKMMFMSGSVAPAPIDATMAAVKRTRSPREEYENTRYKRISLPHIILSPDLTVRSFPLEIIGSIHEAYFLSHNDRVGVDITRGNVLKLL